MFDVRMRHSTWNASVSPIITVMKGFLLFIVLVYGLHAKPANDFLGDKTSGVSEANIPHIAYGRNHQPTPINDKKTRIDKPGAPLNTPPRVLVKPNNTEQKQMPPHKADKRVPPKNTWGDFVTSITDKHVVDSARNISKVGYAWSEQRTSSSRKQTLITSHTTEQKRGPSHIKDKKLHVPSPSKENRIVPSHNTMSNVTNVTPAPSRQTTRSIKQSLNAPHHDKGNNISTFLRKQRNPARVIFEQKTRDTLDTDAAMIPQQTGAEMLTEPYSLPEHHPSTKRTVLEVTGEHGAHRFRRQTPTIAATGTTPNGTTPQATTTTKKPFPWCHEATDIPKIMTTLYSNFAGRPVERVEPFIQCEDNCGFEASPNIPIVVRGVFDIFATDLPWLVCVWTVLVEGVQKVDEPDLILSYHDTPNVAYINTRKLLPSINYWVMVELESPPCGCRFNLSYEFSVKGKPTDPTVTVTPEAGRTIDEYTIDVTGASDGAFPLTYTYYYRSDLSNNENRDLSNNENPVIIQEESHNTEAYVFLYRGHESSLNIPFLPPGDLDYYDKAEIMVRVQNDLFDSFANGSAIVTVHPINVPLREMHTRMQNINKTWQVMFIYAAGLQLIRNAATQISDQQQQDNKHIAEEFIEDLEAQRVHADPLTMVHLIVALEIMQEFVLETAADLSAFIDTFNKIDIGNTTFVNENAERAYEMKRTISKSVMQSTLKLTNNLFGLMENQESPQSPQNPTARAAANNGTTAGNDHHHNGTSGNNGTTVKKVPSKEEALENVLHIISDIGGEAIGKDKSYRSDLEVDSDMMQVNLKLMPGNRRGEFGPLPSVLFGKGSGYQVPQLPEANQLSNVQIKGFESKEQLYTWANTDNKSYGENVVGIELTLGDEEVVELIGDPITYTQPVVLESMEEPDEEEEKEETTTESTNQNGADQNNTMDDPNMQRLKLSILYNNAPVLEDSELIYEVFSTNVSAKHISIIRLNRTLLKYPVYFLAKLDEPPDHIDFLTMVGEPVAEVDDSYYQTKVWKPQLCTNAVRKITANITDVELWVVESPEPSLFQNTTPLYPSTAEAENTTGNETTISLNLTTDTATTATAIPTTILTAVPATAIPTTILTAVPTTAAATADTNTTDTVSNTTTNGTDTESTNTTTNGTDTESTNITTTTRPTTSTRTPLTLGDSYPFKQWKEGKVQQEKIIFIKKSPVFVFPNEEIPTVLNAVNDGQMAHGIIVPIENYQSSNDSIVTMTYTNTDVMERKLYIGMLSHVDLANHCKMLFRGVKYPKPFLAMREKMNMTVTINTLNCVFYNKTTQMWRNEGCEPSPETNNKHIVCACHHLSSFTSEILVQPNKIEISLEDLRLVDFFSNPLSTCIIVVFWCLYVLILLWARREDENDQLKVNIPVLMDNPPDGQYVYLVTVVTGWFRDAGTSSIPTICLSGSRGDSFRYALYDPVHPEFDAGSEKTFILTTKEYLGTLNKLYVMTSLSGLRPRWFLRQITVYEVEEEKELHFMCNEWLTPTDPDSLKQTLRPTKLFQYSYRYGMTVRRNIRDQHLWLSILTRPSFSKFSRKQRATCGFTYVSIAMLVSIMFYGQPPPDPHNQYQVYSIKISRDQIMKSIQCSAISIPINACVVIMFKQSRSLPTKVAKVKVKKDKDGEEEDLGEGSEIEELRRPSKPKKSILKNRHGGAVSSKKMPSVAESSGGTVVESSRGTVAESSQGTLAESSQGTVAESSGGTLAESSGGTVAESFGGTVFSNPASAGGMSHDPASSSDDSSSNNNNANANNNNNWYQDNDDDDYDSDDENQNQNALPCLRKNKEDDKEKKEKKPYKQGGLPHYFVYVGYFVAFCASVTSGFFVLLYGLEYGLDTSFAWATTFFSSFFQSTLAVAPIKVLLVTGMLSLVVKTPIRPLLDYNSVDVDALLAAPRIFHYPDDIDILPPHIYRGPPKRRIRRVKQHIQKIETLNGVFYDICFYLMFLLLIMLIAFGERHPKSYYMNKSVKDMLVNSAYADAKKFHDVVTIHEIWDYLLTAFLPFTQQVQVYREDVGATLVDLQNVLVGVPRIRQTRKMQLNRKTETLCRKNDPVYTPLHPYLVKPIDRNPCENEDTENYYTGWYTPFESNEGSLVLNASAFDTGVAWNYQTHKQLQSPRVFYGRYGFYSGGGYSVDFYKNGNATRTLLLYLKDNFWLDEGTAAVFVEFAIFNPAIKTFCIGQLVFEVSPLGKVVTNDGYIKTLKIIDSISPNDIFLNVLRFFSLVAVFFYGRQLYKEIKDRGRMHLKYAIYHMFKHHKVSVFVFVTSFVSWSFCMGKMWFEVRQRKKFNHRHRTGFFSLYTVIAYSDAYTWSQAITLFGCMANIIQFPIFFRFFQIIKRAIYILLKLSLYGFILTMGLCHAGYYRFAADSTAFKNLRRACLSMVGFMVRELEFEGIVESHTFMIQMMIFLGVICSFIWVVIFPVTQIVLISVMSELRRKKIDRSLYLTDYFIARIKEVCGFPIRDESMFYPEDFFPDEPM